MKNANIVFGRNTVKFIGFRCIFGRSKSFLVVLWLVFMAFHGFSFLREGFGIRSGRGMKAEIIPHGRRLYTTWGWTLHHKGQDFVPHGSKIVPNEQQIGHVTLVGSEPKEI